MKKPIFVEHSLLSLVLKQFRDDAIAVSYQVNSNGTFIFTVQLCP